MKKQFDFLERLSVNNNRDWFIANKSEYEELKEKNKIFFENIYNRLQEVDSLQKLQIFRIYRDVRFKKDKTPYKTHFGASFVRTKPLLRGGYYIHLEPNNTFIGGGFWAPDSKDLFRIRKEFDRDYDGIKRIIEDDLFKKYFVELIGEDGVKTAPKGFDKNSPAINLIKKKQYGAMRKFTNQEVFDKGFDDEIIKTFIALRPFFDYMTEVLNTDLNGEYIY